MKLFLFMVLCISTAEAGTGCNKTCICQRWPIIILAFTLFAIGAVGMIVSYVSRQATTLEHKHHYGIVMDAGSSHTDINIYRWPSNVKYEGTAKVNQIAFAECSDVGISSFRNDPSKVTKVIDRCINDFALSKIPKKDRHDTPVYIGATAGMRLLCARDKSACDQILGNITHALQKYKFNDKSGRVSILSGNEEGVYGWISVNLLKERIPKKKSSKDIGTTGALDMGGASVEITFVPNKGTTIPSGYSNFLRLYGRNYTVYTHSFLCYGMNEAERRQLASLVQQSNFSSRVINPCYPKDFIRNMTAHELWLQPCSMKPKNIIFPIKDDKIYTFVGGSDHKKCQKSVENLFNETSCNFGTCSFNGVYQPNITGNFSAYSGFAYLGGFFNMTQGDKLDKMAAGINIFCDKNWNTIKKDYPKVPHKHLPIYCFRGFYINQILTYGFHFGKKSQRIAFEKKVNGKAVSWTLGLMVNASNLIPSEEPKRKITEEDYVLFTSLSAVVLAFGMVLFVCYAVKKCRASKSDQYNPL